MAKPRKCIIEHCPCIICPTCKYWHNPENPAHAKIHSKCHERPDLGRKTQPTCISCRAGFSSNRNKTWAERDMKDRQYQKLHERYVYMNQHPVRTARRREKEVRTMRATNRAPTTRAA
jgi:hypothetical protein